MCDHAVISLRALVWTIDVCTVGCYVKLGSRDIAAACRKYLGIQRDLPPMLNYLVR
jgi:hypothetical protein